MQPAHDRGGHHGADALVDRAGVAAGNRGDLGQPGHGLLDENVARPAVHTGGAGAGHDLHRQNAVAAEVEERVVDADPFEAEDLGIDAGEDFFDRAGRGAVCSPVGVFGCRQGAGVEFAVGGQRQRVQDHHRGRHHVGRQPVGQRARGLRPGLRCR